MFGSRLHLSPDHLPAVADLLLPPASEGIKIWGRADWVPTEMVLPTRLRNIVERVGEERIVELCRRPSKRRAAEWLEHEVVGVGKKSSRILADEYWTPPASIGAAASKPAEPSSAPSSAPTKPTPQPGDLEHDEFYCMDRVDAFLKTQLRRNREYLACWCIVSKRIKGRSVKPWVALFEEMRGVQRMSMSREFHAKVLTRYAQSVVARSEVAYPKTPSQREIEMIVTRAALHSNPMAVFRRLKLSPFPQVDAAALESGWWAPDSGVRCAEAVFYEFDAWAVQQLKCTAVERDGLASKTAALIQQPEAALHRRIDELVQEARLIGYETVADWLITTPEWARRASVIYNVLNDKERDPEPPFAFLDDAEESDWNAQQATARDADGCASDAFLTWLIGRVVRAAGMQHPPTSEQLDCVLTTVKSPRSILTAEAGTGKTDYGLRLAVGVMQRLGYHVLVATPTHAAKRPIVSALGWKKKTIHTVKSLTFVPPWGAPAKLADILQSLTAPLAVFIDEMGMCGTEDVAELFSLLRRHAVRIAMSGDHRQLPPVSPGSPFDDVIRLRAVPVSTMTKVFRAESDDLTRFNRIYRPGREDAKDWSFDPRSEHYIMNAHPSVTHVATASMTDLETELDRTLSHLAKAGLVESELLLITNRNSDCLEFSHAMRRIFRPVEEAERRRNSLPDGRISSFARGDGVFFTRNTKWYKNGDDAVVRSATPSTADVDILLDDEDHALLLGIRKSRDTPDDDSWVRYRDGLPQEFHCIDDNLWRITVEQDTLKPLNAVTFYKSQGVQFSHIIVALCSGNFITSRHMYTGGTRARRRLLLLGPRCAFDNDAIHKEGRGRTTVLSALLDEESHEACVTDREDDDPSVVQFDLRRTQSRSISKSLRMHTWRRFFSGAEWGRCRCCNAQVSVWSFHVCHIEAHANGGGPNDANLCVGCPTCNLRCGTRNFDDYSRIRKARCWTVLRAEYGEDAALSLQEVLDSKSEYAHGCRRIERTIGAASQVSEENVSKLFRRAEELGLLRRTRVEGSVAYSTYRLT